MEAGFALLNIHPASGTRLRVLRDPALRLMVLGVSVLALVVHLLARLTRMPRRLVLEAHLKAALAGDAGVPGSGTAFAVPAIVYLTS